MKIMKTLRRLWDYHDYYTINTKPVALDPKSRACAGPLFGALSLASLKNIEKA